MPQSVRKEKEEENQKIGKRSKAGECYECTSLKVPEVYPGFRKPERTNRLDWYNRKPILWSMRFKHKTASAQSWLESE